MIIEKHLSNWYVLLCWLFIPFTVKSFIPVSTTEYVFPDLKYKEIFNTLCETRWTYFSWSFIGLALANTWMFWPGETWVNFAKLLGVVHGFWIEYSRNLQPRSSWDFVEAPLARGPPPLPVWELMALGNSELMSTNENIRLENTVKICITWKTCVEDIMLKLL